MSFKEHMKEEWDFYKRNPEMFLLWFVIIISAIYGFYKEYSTP